MLVATQPYRLEPAGAFVLKNISPAEQEAGRDVPVLRGRVELAAEKSTLLLCVRKSMAVWPNPRPAASAASTRRNKCLTGRYCAGRIFGIE